MADGCLEFFDSNTGVLYRAGYEFYCDPDTVVIEWATRASDGKKVRLSRELRARMEVVAMQDHYAWARKQATTAAPATAARRRCQQLGQHRPVVGSSL